MNFQKLPALLGLLLVTIMAASSGCDGGPSRSTKDAQQRVRGTGQTFHGYACTKDCSGHRAGYDWAERKGIGDPAQCTGKSRSFIEGCRVYAEGN